MAQVKKIVIGMLAMLMLLSCFGSISVNAATIYEPESNSSYGLYGKYGEHNETQVGTTQLLGTRHAIWVHTMYSRPTNTTLYAFCLDYGKKARSYSKDKNGGLFKIAKWPSGAIGNTSWSAINKILKYGSTYMINDTSNRFNYLTLQAITWASIPNSKLPGTAYITMEKDGNYTDDEYTYKEPVFTEKADELASNLILQKSLANSKNAREDDEDWCKTCNGYGYVYDYVITCYWGWGNSTTAGWNGDSGHYDIELTDKTEDWDYQDVYQDYYDSDSGDGWSYYNYRTYSVTSKKRKDCPNPNCDLQNYQEYNKNQSFIKDYDDKYWELWSNYCDMKYYMHIMSQVPSYARKTQTNSQKDSGRVKLYWNDINKRFEVIVTDSNLVTAQDITDDNVDDMSSEDAPSADGDAYGYFFADYDGFHFSYYKGKTLIWWNNSDDRTDTCKPEDYSKASMVTLSTLCSAMKDKTAKLVFWQQINNSSTSGIWQNFFTITEGGKPTEAFLTLEVMSPYIGKAPSSSDVKIQLVDINNEVVDHIIPGEKYKVRYTYTYSGGSKGYGLTKKNTQYDVDEHRVIDQMNGYAIHQNLKSKYNGKYYVQEMKYPTEVTMTGTYEVYRVPYVYTNDLKTPWLSTKHSVTGSGGSIIKKGWKVKLFLDSYNLENTISSCINNEENEAWKEKGFTYTAKQKVVDGKNTTYYETNHKYVTEQDNSTSSIEKDQPIYMKVEPTNTDKDNPTMKVTWEYETAYQVFRAPLTDTTASINVPLSENSTKFFAKEKHIRDMNGRRMKDDNGIIIDKGEEVNKIYKKYTKVYYDMDSVTTNNATLDTYCERHKDYKLFTDVSVSYFKASSGDGVTSVVDLYNKKYINYQFYYDIELTNDKALVRDYYWGYDSKLKDDVITKYYRDTNNTRTTNELVNRYKTKAKYKKETITGIDDIIQTDVATQLIADSLEPTVLFEHIQTGHTLIQTTVPVPVSSNAATTHKFSVSVNTNAKNYNSTDNGFRQFYETEFDADLQQLYGIQSVNSNNTKSCVDEQVKAIDPTKYTPKNVTNIYPLNTLTKFNIYLANVGNISVRDAWKLNYNDEEFEFNKAKVSNGVYAKRNSSGLLIKKTDKSFIEAPFYKYSSTKYRTLKKGSWVNVTSDDSNYASVGQEAVESYKLTKVLFKSNYTKKYEEDDKLDASDNTEVGWVDLVADQDRPFDEKKARVAAGQGFELKVQITYTNNNLVQYLEKTVDKYHASQNPNTTFSSKLSYIGKQYANHFYGTKYDGTDESGLGLLSDANGDPVEIYGSNIYEDLYASLSDNANSVYSFTGIENTMKIWNMDKQVNCDYANNMISIVYTYTMKLSHENGVSSNYQTMRFYTNQLSPDSKKSDSESAKHYINLWTAVFPALEIDDDLTNNSWNFDNQSRYLGDVTKLQYLITSTGADDSIVHIVQ